MRSNSKFISLICFITVMTFMQCVQEQDKRVRYFLSKVELINNRYTPTVIKSLFQNDVPLYKEWSGLYYPSHIPYEVVLVRIKFNTQIDMDKNYYIKEIKNKQDWEEMTSKYNFRKEAFGK